MKQLPKEDLHGVIRELDESPHLERWLIASKEELVEVLIGAEAEDVAALQGQILTINQILDKRTNKG